MKRKLLTIAVLLLLYGTNGYGKPRIAVLNFELSDMTSLPNTVAEQQRTASLRLLLAQMFRQSGDYEVIDIGSGDQTAAEAGLGYLFQHHDLAARLGQRFGADWVIVGRHSKPSFLFSYLMAHVIRVDTGRLAANYNIELKGNHAKVTQRSVAALYEKLNDFILKSGTH